MERRTLTFERYQVDEPDGSPVGDLLRALADVADELEQRTDGRMMAVDVTPVDGPLRLGQVIFRLNAGLRPEDL